MERLLNVIAELKAPKNQTNNFGKYSYRSCEDILEAVKPLLIKQKLIMAMSDKIINVGNHNYVESTVIVSDLTGKVLQTVSASAREPEAQKGMSDSQLTGSSSSYARKYALNGMFLIDDTKDDDTRDHSKEQSTKQQPPKSELSAVMGEVITMIKSSGFDDNTMASLRNTYSGIKTLEQAKAFKEEVVKLKTVQQKFVDDFKDDDIPFGEDK